MKSMLSTKIAASLVLYSILVTVAHADVAVDPTKAKALASAHACFGCHGIDKKILGPAYRDVALRYSGKNVVAELVANVQSGSTGRWGNVPMPPNNISSEDAKVVVQWILAGAKD
jgi:cytochrome c